MAFNTFAFLVFFAVVLIMYYLVPKKYQWVFLLLSSYFFYLYASVKFAAFIILTTVTSYYAAIRIDDDHKREKAVLAQGKETLAKEEKKTIKEQGKKRRKRMLVILLVLNFGILVFLKYFNFFADNLNLIVRPITRGGEIPTLNLILPLGISFYTFQTMSYVIDVYWQKVEAERNIAKVALFVSFFPQIIEGPIGRYKELGHQLYAQRKADAQTIKYGLQLMAWGYFKKLVIADRVGIVADHVFGGYDQMSGSVVAIGVFLYAIQDYTDFSGCIDIARGVAQTMGINMAENFRRPYFSKTIPEFWRRWHMSLGAWMKDYVFYPFSLTKKMRNLSKSAKNKFGRHFGATLPIAVGNILVFFLVGVWHGASWNYIVWGIYYGVLIAISGMIKPVYDYLNEKLHVNVKSKGWQLWQIVRTFWLTCVGCIIFRADGLADAWHVFTKSMHIFDLPANYAKEFLMLGIKPEDLYIIPVILIILLVVDIMQECMSVRSWLENRSVVVRVLIYFVGFLFIIGLGIYGPGFDQSQFVYMQF